MEWQIRSDAPIYSQLVDQVRFAVASGIYSPGDRLPSVRDMATEAGVNPNTMQRALTELERCGLVFSQRTAGRFVTEDKEMVDNARKGIAEANIRTFLDSMGRLGFMREEILSMLESRIKEEKGNDAI